MHGVSRLAIVVILLIVALAATITSEAGQQPSASSGWVKLPAPGDTTASAFVSVNNPT